MKYEQPSLEILYLSSDVVTTSGPLQEGSDENDSGDWGATF